MKTLVPGIHRNSNAISVATPDRDKEGGHRSDRKIVHSLRNTMPHPLTRLRLVLILAASSIFAVCIITFLDVVWPSIEVRLHAEYLGYQGNIRPWDQTFHTWVFSVAVGFPVSLLSCIIFGFPVWRRLEKKGILSVRNVIIWGAFVGLVIGLISVILSLAFGLYINLDDNQSFDAFWYGHQIEADGLPTALGWLFKGIDLLSTVIVGALTGLVVLLLARTGIR